MEQQKTAQKNGKRNRPPSNIAGVERRILATKAVVVATGLSRTTIWRLTRAGQFPQSVKISSRRVGFLADDVANWIESKRI